MDMMLDACSSEFIENPNKGCEFAEWRKKQISRRKHKLAEALREEAAVREAESFEE